MNGFAQSVTIVTGGTSGIGRALCEEMGAQGATVIVAGRDLERAQQVAAAIRERGGQAHASHVDVSVESSVAELVDRTVKTYGRLDYMFNNAGVSVFGAVRDLDIEHWRSMVDVNLWGVVYGTTMAYEVMLRQGSGHIVNMSSASGLFPVSFITPYAMAKHAVVALSWSLRAEAAALGVKVSVVCPGAVRTNLNAATAYVNVARDTVEQYHAKQLRHTMEARQAARSILKGVARNRAIIVFPFAVRFMWWLYRASPSLWYRLGLRYVRAFRRHVESRRPSNPRIDRDSPRR